jgi:peptidoglycan hydrolase-like protein with peptidoglycan-binding domain
MHHSKRVLSHKGPQGQQSIDTQRATEIQTALVKAHYLNGAPSGVWDSDTRDAMARFQAANGWQTKLTPDSRALIKLGLGPSHAGDLKTGDNSAATQTASSGTLGSEISAAAGMHNFVAP